METCYLLQEGARENLVDKVEMGKLGCEGGRVSLLLVKQKLLFVAAPSPSMISSADLFRMEVLAETVGSE